MKKIIFFMLLACVLNAKTIVDLYRQKGIKEVEEYLKAQLLTDIYWQETIKNKDVRLGYYEDLNYLLISDKANKTLDVYQNMGKNLKKIITYDKVIDGIEGNKNVEGDLKTPIGAYKITKRTTIDDQFYGPMQFPLNYPNIYDKVQKKTGHGIWIHGSPLNGEPREPNSKGCLVFDNARMKDLDSKITDKKTSVIIYDQPLKEVSKSHISRILADLYKWKDAWTRSDIDGYLSFYDDGFKYHDGTTMAVFRMRKTRIFGKKESKSIRFSKINIAPHPMQKKSDVYRVTFYEDYKAPSFEFHGNKTLFVKVAPDKIKILTEK